MRALKQKAQKDDLTELMQMLMMKAFLLSKNAADSGVTTSSSSSSSEPWFPKDGPDALNNMTKLAALSTHPESVNFAATLKSGALDEE